MKKNNSGDPKATRKSAFMTGYDIEVNADIAAQNAFDRMKQVGFGALTEQEKTVATVWLFAGKVASSGFHGFFSSDAGDLAFYAPTALKNIGAFKMAKIAAAANSAFGSKGPPKDRGARRKVWRSFPGDVTGKFEALESSFYKCADDLDELLEKYVKKAGAS